MFNIKGRGIYKKISFTHYFHLYLKIRFKFWQKGLNSCSVENFKDSLFLQRTKVGDLIHNNRLFIATKNCEIFNTSRKYSPLMGRVLAITLISIFTHRYRVNCNFCVTYNPMAVERVKKQFLGKPIELWRNFISSFFCMKLNFK